MIYLSKGGAGADSVQTIHGSAPDSRQPTADYYDTYNILRDFDVGFMLECYHLDITLRHSHEVGVGDILFFWLLMACEFRRTN